MSDIVTPQPLFQIQTIPFSLRYHRYQNPQKTQSEKSNSTITDSRICHLKSEIQGEIGNRVVDARDRE
ncbi:unnamed protein product [Lactuca virosa]|uniref:Uncharacterized protein n=1 Tax=Lactuca virosa TaxID=75947 RepID=A0AAU9NQX6_9ASTR|nr:unnamed protein product [Lactuca virosa]